jgi:hypothetical protein
MHDSNGVLLSVSDLRRRSRILSVMSFAVGVNGLNNQAWMHCMTYLQMATSFSLPLHSAFLEPLFPSGRPDPFHFPRVLLACAAARRCVWFERRGRSKRVLSTPNGTLRLARPPHCRGTTVRLTTPCVGSSLPTTGPNCLPFVAIRPQWVLPQFPPRSSHTEYLFVCHTDLIAYLCWPLICPCRGLPQRKAVARGIWTQGVRNREMSGYLRSMQIRCRFRLYNYI